MKILCMSDLHGFLPDPKKMQEVDVVVIAGDLCPVLNHKPSFQMTWLNYDFNKWCRKLPANKVIAVAGNHDFIFESALRDHVHPVGWTYLQDSGVGGSALGINFWGSPWQLPFNDWAFNMDETGLEEKWKKIPEDTDVLIVHGPPYGYGDQASRLINDDNETDWPFEHVGSKSLLARIGQLKLKLVVFGHIHEGYGQYIYTTQHELPVHLINASIMNLRYQPVNPPVVFEI